MANLKLNCPFASYDEKMKIRCSKADSHCGHQAWKTCKGWSVLTEGAAECPLRKEQKNERKRATGKKRTN